MSIQLPNAETTDVKCYGTEYVTSPVLNRASYRLLENDLILADSISLSACEVTEAPTTSGDDGSIGNIALSGDYLFVYDHEKSAWGKTALDYNF